MCSIESVLHTAVLHTVLHTALHTVLHTGYSGRSDVVTQRYTSQHHLTVNNDSI